jgi:hypothetical protein
MDMAGIHIVEMEGMDMVDERPLNHHLKVEGMYMEDITTKVVERGHVSVVLARHWIGDGTKWH